MPRWVLTLVAGVCFAAFAVSVGAQERLASLEQEPPAEGLAFRYRASRPGDQAHHRYESALELDTSIHQAGQRASQRTESIRRRKRYHVALLAPGPGESARAKIVFQSAHEDRRETDSAAVESSSLPVDGRTYLACRIDQRLAVYDTRGQGAPPEESQWVERTLRSLGQRNPLGAFLDGQRISVGQRLTLPVELARELWDFGEELGVADHCELVLREVAQRPTGSCGRFEIVVRAAHDGGRLDLAGHLVVQASTCRTLESSLRGSFASRSRRGPAGWEFSLERSGQIEVSTGAEPADVPAAARVQ
jgi:hypothetical protein